MEAHVAAGVTLLVALSLSAALFATMRAVTERFLTRTSEDLEAGRATFVRSLSARIESAAALTRLITELPIFRAHMSDRRLRNDEGSITAMTDAYRRQLQAGFCVVTDARGVRIGSAGLSDRPPIPPSLDRLIAGASRGNPQRGVVALDGRLFLVVVEPVRFAEEVLGTFSVAYALDDRVAAELAAQTHSEVSLLSGTHLSGSSLGGERRAALERVVAEAPGPERLGSASGLWNVAGEQYVAGVFPLFDGDENRLVLLQPWTPMQQFLDALRRRFLATGAVIFACALLAGFAFSRRTSEPLREIAAAAREIAEGRLERQVPVRGSAEATTLAMAFNHMSTSLRGAQERLLHDALHDHLTELPNRALFMDRLQQAIARRERHPERGFAVLFIDLDRFKTVNDSIGHPAGDRLLLETASRLTTVLRRQDTASRTDRVPAGDSPNTLARVGGDEFTVLVEDIHDPSDAVRVAERLQTAIAAPVTVDGQVVFPTASIGIAIAAPGLRSGDDLVREADTAMYRAKSAGGDRCAVFDSTMHQKAVERLQLETDLRHAFERREFTLRYQPIVRLSTGTVAGFEALLRWNHPDRGLLDPSAFLRVAEETGLMPRIDDWVLGQACADACVWRRRHERGAPISVSVNVSGQGFGRADLVRQVSTTLERTGVDPAGLRLEITESVAMADAERARVVLAELKALGVRLSLDDFGTGYSSLSYLQRFPVDTLKIDRSFVVAMEQNDECREIVRTVLNLAATLGLEAIAEGAESAREIEALAALGCDLAQGYYFSPPLPLAEALDLTTAGASRG
jgi:predicted signal transduction protein with EAL and GGDEF domain